MKEPKSSNSTPRRIYTEHERTIIRELVSTKKHIVENKEKDAVTKQNKVKAWEQITKAFNVQPGVNVRTADSVKKCWDNMKEIAKREFRDEHVEIFRTGGGSSEKAGPSKSSVEVHAIVASQIDPLVNEFDDDAQDFLVAHEGNQLAVIENIQTIGHDPPPEIVIASFDINATNGITSGSDGNGTGSNGNNSGPKKKAVKRKRGDYAESLVELEKIEHDAKMKYIQLKMDSKKMILDQKLAAYRSQEKYWSQKCKKDIEN